MVAKSGPYTLSTGTPRGITTLRHVANGCIRRVWLNKVSEQQEYGVSGDINTLIGSMVHAFLARYYLTGNRNLDVSKATFKDAHNIPDNIYIEALEKAQTIFGLYRVNHSPKEFGEVLFAEKEILNHLDGITCAIDLVVKVGKKDCTRLEKSFGLSLEPGIYLVDHKTAAFYNALLHDKYTYDVQFASYLLAWEVWVKSRKVQKKKPYYPEAKGLIANVITKGKVPEVHRVVSRLDRSARGRLNYIITRAYNNGWPEVIYKDKKNTLSTDTPLCNPGRCYDFYRLCPHWVSGRCKRC